MTVDYLADVPHYEQVRLLNLNICHLTYLVKPGTLSMHPVLLQSCLLGQGTFGIVVKALDLRCDTPQEVAIKLLPRGDVVSSRQMTAGT